MKYYGIVNEIKKEHKSGIYGRKTPTKKDFQKLLNKLEFGGINPLVIPQLLSPSQFLFELAFDSFKKEEPITLKSEIKYPYKIIIIPNELLNNNYNLDEEFSYGLFDGFSSKEKTLAFKTIMQSKGGSSLNIIQRNNMPPNLKHFGGEGGRFNEGLYVTHPKDENLLLPLKGFTNLIQTLILEETIRAYEALGAKEIIIEDVTEIENDLNLKKEVLNAGINSQYKKEVLRLKKFGKGTFDIERALSDKLFIHDIPAVMSTIDARINGNQILEEFTETINLNIGIDVSVLGLFELNNNFSYQRRWHFKVEFYDKNEI